MARSFKQEDQGPNCSGEKVRSYLKITKGKSWKHSSSGRGPASQVQSPEFKCQSYPHPLPSHKKRIEYLKRIPAMSSKNCWRDP
jgi:hypothetical protein